MRPARRRLVVWSIVTAAAMATHALLASRLAGIDPIGALLLKREGPAAAAALLVVVRVFVILVAPAWGACVAASLAVDAVDERAAGRRPQLKIAPRGDDEG